MQRLSRSLLGRAALLSLLLVAATSAPAHAEPQALRVVVVDGLELEDLRDLEGRGAVGLLVPGAGPRVSEAAALAGLERGKVRSSYRSGLPSGNVLIRVERDDEIPDGPAIVLGLPEGGDQENDRRYPIAVLADGYRGLLTSPSTRLPGLVSVGDVAPTALANAERALGSVAADDATSTLAALDERIADNASARAIGALIAGLLILLLAAIRPRAALLAFATTLLANGALGLGGVSEPWLVWLVLGLAAGAIAPLLAGTIRSPLAVGLALSAAIGIYLAMLALEPAAVALSPLGSTQVSRFYGLSNLLSALLLVPALAGPALLQRELGWLAGAALAAVSLVAVAGSSFGADGGTAIALLAAYIVLGFELVEAYRRRAALLVASLVIAAVAGLTLLDASTGRTSHLTDAVGGGPSGLAADLRDRVVLSWERATDRWYYATLTAAAALVLVGLVVRLFTTGEPRTRRALPLALGVATVVSLVTNDSPLDVAAAGLLGYLTVYAYVQEDEPFGRGAGDAASYASVET
jgi:hypothetical protein